MMRAELLQLAADLARKREPFVLAMVASDTSISTRETVWRLLKTKTSPNSTQTV